MTGRSKTEGPLSVAHHAFWLPKQGHRTAEYEDAFSLQDDAALPFCAAVADGATETAFAKAWAERLTSGFVADRPEGADALAALLPQWQAAWRADVGEQTSDLPWYAAAKAEEGAFAALLGLTLRPDASWHALAVGDACLFHLRGGRLVGRPWPVETAGAFGHHPTLVPSLPGPHPPAETRRGTWRPGDTFLLATDALAAWLMQTGPAAALRFTPQTFRPTLQKARAAHELRNDDATLIVLEIA